MIGPGSFIVVVLPDNEPIWPTCSRKDAILGGEIAVVQKPATFGAWLCRINDREVILFPDEMELYK